MEETEKVVGDNGHSLAIVGATAEKLPDDTQYIAINELLRLVRLVDQSDVVELEVRHNQKNGRLTLRKFRPAESSSPQDVPQGEASPVATQAADSTEQARYTITAPCVGIFQNLPKAKDQPPIAVGSMVQEGQYIGAIRSLNIPTEVEAPAAGEVIEVLVQDGQPVGYGQPLMTIAKQ
jgi:biotin carboxyl carrier protein